MGILLRLLIRFYQLFLPNQLKGNGCIFNESCSHHVYRISKKQGFVAAVKAFEKRRKNCRPGYHIISVDDKRILITVRNEIVPENEVNPSILEPYSVS